MGGNTLSQVYPFLLLAVFFFVCFFFKVNSILFLSIDFFLCVHIEYVNIYLMVLMICVCDIVLHLVIEVEKNKTEESLCKKIKETVPDRCCAVCCCVVTNV